jgi:hypothetical protein
MSLTIYHEKSLLEKTVKIIMATNDNCLTIIVCRNLRQAYFFEVGMTQILANNKKLICNMPCRTPCRLFIHENFFGILSLHLLVWSELGWSPPLRPIKALRLQWSQAFSLVWSAPQWLGLRGASHYGQRSRGADFHQSNCKRPRVRPLDLDPSHHGQSPKVVAL